MRRVPTTGAARHAGAPSYWGAERLRRTSRCDVPKRPGGAAARRCSVRRQAAPFWPPTHKPLAPAATVNCSIKHGVAASGRLEHAARRGNRGVGAVHKCQQLLDRGGPGAGRRHLARTQHRRCWQRPRARSGPAAHPSQQGPWGCRRQARWTGSIQEKAFNSESSAAAILVTQRAATESGSAICSAAVACTALVSSTGQLFSGPGAHA